MLDAATITNAPTYTPDQRRSALVAASCATEAASELMRFEREGPEGFSPFGDPEPVQQLAEALLRAARIECALYQDGDQLNAEYIDAVAQLAGVCDTFLREQCCITAITEGMSA